MEDSINKIMEAFQGHRLFKVGGSVRDEILGIKSHDTDLTTDATPSEMITLCKKHNLNFRYTDNSITHGTVTIENIEVTTFRRDVSCDGRNATVMFADTIEEDLSRRDFTINAIAQDVFTGEFIDPFNGMQGIKNKVIRAVGNPRDRLKEDTLRALRAIRFAGQLHFNIDYDLFQAIKTTDISNLSIERVRDELMKIIANKKYVWLRESGLFEKIIPELIEMDIDGGDKHDETVYVHSFNTFEHMATQADNPVLILVALLHDIGKIYTKDDPERMFSKHEDIGAEKVKEIMQRMKFSNDEVDYSYIIVKNHMRWHFLDNNFASPTDKSIRRAIRDLPDKFDKKQMITDLIILTWTDCQANLLNKPESFEDYTERRGIYKRALEILQKQPEIKVGSGLNINGNDLIEMGFKPSPLFNVILKDIENKVFDEELKNIKEELKKYIMEKYGNKERR